MEKLKIIIQLTRLNKPIGFMLLFWPCLWGLTLGYYFVNETSIYFNYIILFFLGSVLMRSAGCIFNDIVDRDFDKKVERTKNRPIASGKISVFESFIYVAILCLTSLLILLQFNKLTIILGMSSMFLAFTYPFMKRITYWPQLFLGLTFNWGIIMAWAAVNNNISYEIIALYISAIFWTLGYDTIYGAQDMKDDEIIGIKSTSIKFKENIKLFVGSSYFLTLIILGYLFKHELGINILTFLFILFASSLLFQLIQFEKTKPEKCLMAFKMNNFSGLILFLGILSRNL